MPPLQTARESVCRGQSLVMQALLACWGRRRRRRRGPVPHGSAQSGGGGAGGGAGAAATIVDAAAPDTKALADVSAVDVAPMPTTPGPDGELKTSTSTSTTSTTTVSPVSPTSPATTTAAEAFLRDAEDALLTPVQTPQLRRLARRLLAQLRAALRDSPASMLPSHTTQLPTGAERGRYLTLDVGGSTLRVAVIDLTEDGIHIPQIQAFKITPAVKQLPGTAFFDWMAARIVETVGGAFGDGELPMGLAWSFPIDGRLQGMGKGFVAADTLLGHDLGSLIESACRAQGLAVRLAAIVNDAPAALLSTAYAQPRATRFGLILGTGVNMAAHLPLASVGAGKLGPERAAAAAAGSAPPHVLVNTEVSMVGGDGVLPLTRWDAQLNAAHPKPAFQPLEHLVSGYYLGEVVRLALVEAVAAGTGLFGGVVPVSLREAYALDTETLSRMAATDTDEAAVTVFVGKHPDAAATPVDVSVVRTLAALVARRSAALVAAAIYALWALKIEVEGERVEALDPQNPRWPLHAAERDDVRAHTVVGFNGSVIEQYPQYRAQCQAALDALLADPESDDPADPASDPASDPAPPTPRPVINLVPAHESSLQGAAVALACLGA